MTAATWGCCPALRRPGELLTRGDVCARARGSGLVCLRTSNLGKGEWNWGRHSIRH